MKYIFAALLILLASTADAAVKRSNKARLDFVRENACPATNLNRLPCPGYVIDHVIPLCGGGEDHPRNMAWMHVVDAKVKDRLEMAYCWSLKR